MDPSFYSMACRVMGRDVVGFPKNGELLVFWRIHLRMGVELCLIIKVVKDRINEVLYWD